MVLGAGALSCGTGTSTKVPPPQAVQKNVALTSFSGDQACTGLETYVEDTMVLQMRSQLEAARDGVPSWGWWGGWGRGGVLYAEAADGAGSATSAPSAPSNYTTTNNQVAGVDEADFVKNDGTRIFVLSGNTLYAAKSWPATELSVQGKLGIEGWPQEMFLADQKVVVFSSIYRWYPMNAKAGYACDTLSCGYSNGNTVKVTTVDVSDLGQPKVINEAYVPGYYVSSRMIGSTVRLVMNNRFEMPDGFKWYPDYEQNLWNDKARLADAYNRLIDSNETLLRKQTLSDWFPATKIKRNGLVTSVSPDCARFSKVNAPTRMGTVSVVTLNLATPEAIDSSSILTEPGIVYSSASNLYVTTQHWWWWPMPGQEDVTYVHKFDITSASAAVYVGSGAIEGTLNNQFSLDEYKGNLRASSTLSRREPDAQNPENVWGRVITSNRVTVLGPAADGSLEVIGKSADLAEGERTMSSRFIEDKGFVVTFRQVDPLFTFDLSDPTNVKKMGELTIPGFSTYLHPLDATHLLTIGEFVPENQNNWQDRALQLAIFDVSDLSAPKQTFTQSVGTAHSWSEALYDHKAFNYFPAKKTLAIPFSDWNGGGIGESFWSTFVSDLRVFNVDAATGFTPRGALSMSDLYQASSSSQWTYYWVPSVRRSVMADDFVYSISDSGLRVANVNALGVPLATAPFDRFSGQ